MNRPFPSSSQPPYQSEAKCEVCYENQFSFILKSELIIITKFCTETRFEREIERNSEMACWIFQCSPSSSLPTPFYSVSNFLK